ncbi:MAG TPA: transposase [Sphingobacteriaceae bacterium]
MNYNSFIGIDVSKLTFDVFVYGKFLKKQFDNTDKGFVCFIKWLKKALCTEDLTQVLICFEHTGLYSMNLALFLQEQSVPFSIVPALDIKCSLGTIRGKSDQLDAERIAEYAYLKKEKLIPTILPSKIIMKLQPLLSLRTKLIADKAGYGVSCNERRSVYPAKEHKELFNVYKGLIKVMEEKIKDLEIAINNLLQNDLEIKRTFKLITGIKGIGPLTAAHLIVYTQNFTKFDSWRKFACYSGIAPFPHSSGTSLKGRTRVSHLANKQIKSLLFLCANVAVQCDPEMKAYYQRRIEEGKSKMSILNIIKNKLISRVFAVMKRQTEYVTTGDFAA